MPLRKRIKRGNCDSCNKYYGLLQKVRLSLFGYQWCGCADCSCFFEEEEEDNHSEENKQEQTRDESE